VEKKPEFFLSDSLAFGATGAVYGFNRCSRSLQHVLSEVFWLPASNYYDDFPMVQPTSLIASSCETFDGLYELIEWTLKVEPRTTEDQSAFKNLMPWGAYSTYDNVEVANVLGLTSLLDAKR
jgi:hypothetical protein